MAEPSLSLPSGLDPLAAADRIDEEFLSRITHDLRTPLAAIKAAIGVVLANQPPGTGESLSRMFQNIDRAADQMNNMITNIAESARLKLGPPALEMELANLNELARRVGRNAELSTRRRGQAIKVELPQRQCLALVDVSRVERALLNLLDNAQRYGPPGSLIQLQLERDGLAYVFSVIDQGPGVPEGAQKRIFEGEDPTARGSGRTGLGLPVARAVAELHGGRIWVDSTPGEGAAFRFTLPAAASKSRSAAQSRIRGRNT